MRQAICNTKLAIAGALLLTLSATSPAAPPTFSLTTDVSCVNGSDCGSVHPASASCKRNCIVSIEAFPEPDWQFIRWEGGVSGSENPLAVRLTEDTHAIAVFSRGSEPPPPPPPPPPVTGCDPYEKSGREVIGYFIQWGVYRRDYHVRNIVESCSADKLTAINYAFAGIGEDLTCISLDPFADYEKRYDADESVDGVADTVSQPLKGNFNQLKKLKALYPDIRLLISIGGWNDSARFSDAALPENREAFVSSCIDLFIRGEFDPAAGVTDPGVFDGIDIDWEYPGACGATCDYRAEDRVNFSALLQEFRTQLDELAEPIGGSYLLTAAVPAAKTYHQLIDLSGIAGPLDWMNIMAYDFHGSWETKGPTNHHANLFDSDGDPIIPPMSVDKAVNEYLQADVPAEQIVIGLPFYGRGWARVADGGTHGLFQEAGRIPRGTWETGVEDYKVLKESGMSEYWDDSAHAVWLYNGNQFWTFDSPRAVEVKAQYVIEQRLGGIMFWELSGDDASGSLVEAIGAGLLSAP